MCPVTMLQMLHVDVKGLADAYKHVLKVYSDMYDLAIGLDSDCCKTDGPDGTPWFMQCDGTCGPHPDLSCSSPYCEKPLNQTDSFEQIKAVVNYISDNVRSAGPQAVKPPGFPRTVRRCHCETSNDPISSAFVTSVSRQPTAH